MIPKVIYQTWVRKTKNEFVDVNRRTWIENNPSFEYEYYDDNDIDLFIKEHFDENVHACYKRIVNGSLKADFFRYCILYIKGGIYIDVDMRCIEPLDTVFDFENTSFIVATDLNSTSKSDNLYQAFLAGVPKMQLFMNAVQHICDCMKDNKFKHNLFNLSGPTMFSRLTKEYINLNLTDEDTPVAILKELKHKKVSTNEVFVVVTHECKPEHLKYNNQKIATCQHRLIRLGTPHYCAEKNKFKNGYYI